MSRRSGVRFDDGAILTQGSPAVPEMDMCCEPGISRWALDEEALQLVGMPAAAVSVAVDLQTDFIGGTNCGFHTYAQCQADIRGIGGYCDPNPAFQTYNRGYQTYIRDARRRARDWQY